MAIPFFSAYTHWLHTRWPAGTVEPLPVVNADGSCNVAGVYLAGDLTGVPLLKFSLHTGTRAVKTIVADAQFQAARLAAQGAGERIHDLVIIGGGVAGMAAAVEARRQGLEFVILEASQPFSTLINFPAHKPIFTYPTGMTPEGTLQVHADVKEGLIEELSEQVREAGIEPRTARAERVRRHGARLQVELDGGEVLAARRVIVAIGRSGEYRRLDVPGEALAKVSNRLHDPKDYAGQKVLVVGGGDSALEAAIALVQAGAAVTLSYRRKAFSRAKPENLETVQALAGQSAIRLMLGSQVKAIGEQSVAIVTEGGREETLANDAVFPMLGRNAPLEFFRNSGIAIRGEGTLLGWGALAVFLLFCVWLYLWKSNGPIPHYLALSTDGAVGWWAALGERWAARAADRTTLLGTLAVSMKSRSFYYTLAYSLAVVVFGIRRIRRRRTPYVTVQTSVLALIQVIPLFLLPEILLPWMGYRGWFDHGTGRAIADRLFEMYIPAQQYLAHEWPVWGHPRAYWRAYGFILAWPLMIYNVFTAAPMVWWLTIAVVQTFVLIPAMVWWWGKGAYCGWICSCGALAETLGDTQRHKMPHGPGWNRLNMAGQAILWIAFGLLGLRIAGWIWPAAGLNSVFDLLLEGKNAKGALVNPASYKWLVDVLLAGILGVGLYFKYSGRVWCRFFCPLAALMHLYARFSRFRIFAEKKKCISCNVCTSVCHQGIDVMNFANKGEAMRDPQCVRCSACVQSCPTGVLTFGRVRGGGRVEYDTLAASPVQMAEKQG